MRAHRIAIAASVLLAAPASFGDAAAENRLREALRTTTGQLRSLEEQQSRWPAEQAALKQRIEALEKEVEVAKKSARPRKAAVCAPDPALQARVAELESAKVAAAEAQAACQKQARESAAALRTAETERTGLSDKLGSLSRTAAACEAKNARLYALGKEILDWLSALGVNGALAAREPFLGLKRVEIENAAQDYEDKLLEQRSAR